MSLRQKDDEVGYKRPPKQTQWKKGQCGNPKRQYQRAPRGTVALIDAAFEKQIAIVEKGESRRVSVFEAILLQLANNGVRRLLRAPTSGTAVPNARHYAE